MSSEIELSEHAVIEAVRDIDARLGGVFVNLEDAIKRTAPGDSFESLRLTRTNLFLLRQDVRQLLGGLLHERIKDLPLPGKAIIPDDPREDTTTIWGAE